MNLITRIAVVLLSLGVPSASDARINTEPTIEWLADQSDAIGLYKIIAAPAPESKPSKWTEINISIKLVDTKRGEPPPLGVQGYQIHPSDADISLRHDIEVAEGQEILCFFVNSPKGQELKLVYLVNLDLPAKHGPHVAYSSSFDVLASRSHILTILDDRIGRSKEVLRKVDTKKHRVEVPVRTPAWRVLYGGSVCYLIIPGDLAPGMTEKQE